MFRVLLVACALLTAGCVAKIQPALTAEDRAAYRIENVDLTVPKTSFVRWSRGETAMLKAAGLTDAPQSEKDAFIGKLESQIELRERAQELLLQGLNTRLIGVLPGSKPMQATVMIETMATSSAGRSFLVGGQQIAIGVIQFHDLETGEALSRPQRLFGNDSGGGGIIGAIVEAASRDPMLRLGERFGENAVKWVTATEPVDFAGTTGDFLNRPADDLPGPTANTAEEGNTPTTTEDDTAPSS